MSRWLTKSPQSRGRGVLVYCMRRRETLVCSDSYAALAPLSLSMRQLPPTSEPLSKRS